MIILLLLPSIVLTSCGGNKGTGNNDVTSETESTQNSDTGDMNSPTDAKEPLELSALLIQYATPPDPNGELWKTIENTFNVRYTIDWVPDADYTNKLNIVLNSGSVPDIVYSVSVTDPTINQAIKGGLFAELTPILGDFSEWPNLGNLNPDAWNTSRVDGKNYLFPRTRGNYDIPIAHLRGDWLDKLGMEVPKTFDEYREYLRAVCNSDMDGNGQMDTIGVTNISAEMLSAAFGPGDKIIVRPEGKDTGIVNVKLTEAYALLLEYMQGMYEEGLISPEYALLNGQQQEELFISGKSAMYVKNIWHRKRMDNELKKIDLDAYSALMFTLEGPNGIAFPYDKGYAGGLLVSAKVDEEKLVRIVQLMEETADPNNFNLICFGIEGVHYTLVEGSPKLTEQGEKEINTALPYPFTYATQIFAKVDSPLADVAYNMATRKMTQEGLDEVIASYVNPLSLDILQSNSWATFWSQRKDEFEAFTADVITGEKSVDDFRDYQKRLLEDPLVINSFDELQKSYDDYGLPEQ